MRRIFLKTALALTFINYGCIKEPDYEKLSTNLVVASISDSTANFASYKTYYISDSVAVVNSNAVDTVLKNANTQKLVDAVKQNMNARGYVFTAKTAIPDLGLMLGIAKNTYIGAVYSGWWDSYYGWWDPWYWGWYYPYYYPYATYYSVTTGSLIMTMADLKNAQVNKNLRVIWTGFSGGAIGDDLATNVDRGVDAINQAFAQSPLVTAK
jgi:hypothetical protein